MSYLSLSLLLGVAAGVANVFGGAIVYARPWRRPLLVTFIGIGSGFMLATVLTEMAPESIRLLPAQAPVLILAGYFLVHLSEHCWPAHFHFGEETHVEAFLRPGMAYTALGGLLVHTFFDGVAITSGFLVSRWLGTVISGAILLHNIPEGFTISSVMLAAQQSRRAGFYAVAGLALSRIVGILAMSAARREVKAGLALSAGVTLYVAASDLIPEVNKMSGLKVALAVGVGVGLVVLLRAIFFAQLTP